MKLLAALIPVVLMTGCAYYPKGDMGPGEALVLTKPISANYNLDGRRVTITHQLEVYGSTIRKRGRSTAAHVPAGEHYIHFVCNVDGYGVRTANWTKEVKPGSCYAPILMNFGNVGRDQQFWNYYHMVTGGSYSPYRSKLCSIALQEVDCGWLREEAKSIWEVKKAPQIIGE